MRRLFAGVVAVGIGLIAHDVLATVKDETLTRQELEELEQHLADLGFQPGKIDGVVDHDTRVAISSYQDFAALTGDPEPSHSLLNELRGVISQVEQMRERPALATAAAPDPLEPESEREPVEPEPEPQAAPPEPEPAEPEPAPQAAPPEPAPEPAEPEPAPQTAAPEPAPEPAEPEPEPQTAAPEPAPEPAEPEPERQAAEPEPALAPEEPASTSDEDDPNVLAMVLKSLEEEAAKAPEGTQQPDPRQEEIAARLKEYRDARDSGGPTPKVMARKLNEEGQRLFRKGNYEAALIEFGAAIELEPYLAAAYHNRAKAYRALGEEEQAAADFDRAYELGFVRLRLDLY